MGVMLIGAVAAMGGHVVARVFAEPPVQPHAAAEAAQEALSKALAAPDLPTARKHASIARGHVRRLEHLSPTCN